MEDSSRNSSGAIRGRTPALAAIAALVLAGALAGCTAGAGAGAARTPAATQSAPERVVINCNLIVTDDDAARLTPPLTPVAGYTPAAGTLGATMVAGGAQPCGWGLGSTASLEVVVAIPGYAAFKAAEAAASTGQVAPSQRGDKIYFQVTDGVGRAQVFIGRYWIEVASAAFTTPEQAQTVYGVVVSNLRSAGG